MIDFYNCDICMGKNNINKYKLIVKKYNIII